MKLAPSAAAGVAALLLASSAAAQDAGGVGSPWGPDDQLGAANRMSAQSILEATKLVTEGRMYSLGIIVDEETPAFPPRSLSHSILQPNQAADSGLGSNAFTYNDDIFMGWLGIGPQIDGLGQSGIDHVYYGGRQVGDFASASGLTGLGLENLPGLVGRGVLLDMAEHYGQNPVPEGTAYTEKDIRAAAEAQGVEIREGDVVLFHSGWLNLLDGENPDPERFGSVEPGLGVLGAEYLAGIGVMAVGADTWGMEVAAAQEKPDSLEIGVTTFLTDPASVFGAPGRDAAELIIERMNAEGGIGGVPVEARFIDKGAGGEALLTEYRRLVEEEGVDAMLASISSGNCATIAPLAEDLEILNIMRAGRSAHHAGRALPGPRAGARPPLRWGACEAARHGPRGRAAGDGVESGAAPRLREPHARDRAGRDRGAGADRGMRNFRIIERGLE